MIEHLRRLNKFYTYVKLDYESHKYLPQTTEELLTQALSLIVRSADYDYAVFYMLLAIDRSPFPYVPPEVTAIDKPNWRYHVCLNLSTALVRHSELDLSEEASAMAWMSPLYEALATFERMTEFGDLLEDGCFQVARQLNSQRDYISRALNNE